jgi:ATP-dependent Clp protease ATP-binding subunit ClpA
VGAEPLSDGAREVVAAAEAEARTLHHARLGTEHLLLGVLSRPDEPGARALAKLGVTLGPTRAQIMRIVGLPETPSPPGELSLTPMARDALAGALREAIEIGHTAVAPEHVLLALLRERDSLAVRVLRDAGIDPRRLREEVSAEAAAGRAPKAAGGAARPPAATPAARAGASATRAGGADPARRGALGAYALLGVLAAGGPAADFLREHGVDEAAVRELLGRLPGA